MSAATRNRRLPNVVIRASAGSGKTHQLSNRLLQLLLSGAAGDQLLAVTFTRKAAGEILDRLLLRLAQGAADPKVAARLGAQLQIADLGQERCRQALLTAAQNLHRLNVSTLDSFFAKIAGSFAFELGLPPGWRIVEEIDDAQIRSAAIEEVLQTDSTRDLLTLMNLLTKGEARRGVSELIRETVKELFLLYLEAPSDAWTRLKKPQPLSNEAVLQAIESLRTAEAPNDKRFRTAIDKDLQNALAGDWESFVAGGLANKVLGGAETYCKKPIPITLIDAYRRLLDHARGVLVGLVANQTEATFKLLEKFAAAYARLKAERRSLRFDDVTHRLLGAADQSHVDELAFRLDASAKHVLLDEFQDTSLAQWRVIRPFAVRAAAQRDASFFCVGDAKQAIYGWRGGSAEILDSLERQLENVTYEGLNVSYRSAQPVIDAVNRVFSNIANHPRLEKHAPAAVAWRRTFPIHETAKTELAGYVALEAAREAGGDQDPQNLVFEDAAARVAEIAVAAPAASIGVLVRTNSAVGRMIYLLRQRGIAASEEGGNPLIDSPAVDVVLSLMRLADHPGDTVARFHLANSPIAESIGLRDHRNDQAAQRIARDFRRRLIEQGYGPVVYRLAVELAAACDDRDLSRLQQLIELAYQYGQRATLRADDFVDYVEQTRVADPSSARVRVMTVHQAKGLQFDVVVLPQLDARLIGQPPWFVVGRPGPTEPVDSICRYTNESVQQMLPKRFQEMFAAEADRTMNEALCVLYVALTRAIHALHMIVAPSRNNERGLPKTFAGLLRAALTDGSRLEAESIAFETGDRNWLQHAPHLLHPLSQAAADADVELPSIQIAPREGDATRGVERVAPSSLEGGPKVRLADVLDPRRTAAMQHGTLVHAWLELVEWLDQGLPNRGRPDVDALRRAAAKAAGDAGDLVAEISRFNELLAQPRIARALSREEYAHPDELGFSKKIAAELQRLPLELELRRELHFAIREPQGLLEGYLDRLVLMRHGDRIVAADVLDFKTDAIAAGDESRLQERIDFYRPQLEAYRRAVMEMTGLPAERVSGRLLFLNGGAIAQI